MPLTDGVSLRRMVDRDADDIIALIDATYAEYPGCVLDLPGVDSDLPVLAAHLEKAGGTGWVVTDADRVVACVGVTPRVVDARPGAHLHRLYVASSHRRRGLGRLLVEQVEHHATAVLGAEVVDLWSDSRFRDAHRLYQRCGYVATGETRRLHDPSDTTEYRFVHTVRA